MDLVKSVLTSGIRNGTTPGLAAFVLEGSGSKCFYLGKEHLGGSPVTSETVYDLASLTKVFCTTVLVAQATSQNMIRLGECPWTQWPNISVEKLLAHTSGLPWWADVTKNPRQILSMQQDQQKIGKRVYSDIGFILLGWLLEERFGKPLDALFERLCLDFYGTNEVYFLRGSRQVNDQNCRSMNGVSGHAGLFATLNGVKRVVEKISSALIFSQSPVEKTLQQMAFARRPGPLGFDWQTSGGSTGGVFSEMTVGHLGYTGTSFWVDPSPLSRIRAVVLLTNRLECGDGTKNLLSLRQNFHQAVFNSK